MAKIINARQAYAFVLGIIEDAHSYIVLITPYLKFIDEQTLNDLKANSVHKVIICRDLHADEYQDSNRIKQQDAIIEKLSSIPNCEVHCCKNLHTKCYFNESRMIISSMNFYESTVSKNFELGIKLDKNCDQDDPLIIQAYSHINDICKACGMAPVNPGDKNIGITAKEAGMGYCIRCKAPIPLATTLDPKEFFCEKHYKSWKKFADVNYDETFCHICGEPDVEFEDRCAAKPICVHCWPKVKKNYK